MTIDRIITISDLHITGPKRSFFSAGKALQRFLQYQAARAGTTELVVLGDALDYLTFDDALAFTEDAAVRKTRAILDHNRDLFGAFKSFADHGQGRTIRWFLGNHDVELLFPAARTLVNKAITGSNESHAALMWMLDGKAFDYALPNGAKARFRHGNHGDLWNEIDYEAAKRCAEGTGSFSYPPGSRLVANVINKLKDDGYKHIDLLKPEDTVAIPLTIALWPDKARTLASNAFGAWFGKMKSSLDYFFNGGAPRTFDGAAQDADETSNLLAAALHEALADAGGEAVTAGEVAQWVKEAGSDDVELAMQPGAATFGARGKVFARLMRSIARFANAWSNPFAVHEHDSLEDLAKNTLATDGVEVVVAGHTHLARAIHYPGGYYFNTGTWADLISIPPNTPASKFHQLATQIKSALEDPATAPWSLRPFRRLTYVEIEMSGTEYTAALKVWPEEDSITVQAYP